MMQCAIAMEAIMPAPVYAQIFRARQPAIRGVLVAIEAALADADPDLASRAELVLAELLNNVQRHGGAEDAGAGARPVRIVLQLSLRGDGLVAVLIDDGCAIPPGCLSAPALPDPESLPESGFGWSLIHILATDLHYWREMPCNILSFRVPA